MLRPLTLTALASVLVACGGGGGGSSPAPVVPQSIAGSVVDGYIAGATVSCLARGSLVAVTTSDASGGYTFNLVDGQTCDTIESRGGIDVGATPGDPSDDRIAPAGVLRAPVPTGSASVAGLAVTPVTTLVQALVAGGATPDAAQAQVRTALGLPASLDLLGTDPVGDPALYKATAVVAQLVEQIGDALAAAGGITDVAGRQALADAALSAIVAKLPSLTMAALAPAPGALTPSSPLFELVAQAANNAKASRVAGVAAALQGMDAITFAAISAPLVASASRSVNGAANVADAVARVNLIGEQARSATVLAGLRSAVSQPAGDPQTVLGEVAAALAAADAGAADTPFSVSVGGASVHATMPAGLSNHVLVRDDLITFSSAAGSTSATIGQIETSGVSVPRELVSIGFGLDASAGNTQLSAIPIVVPLAVQVTDASRTFQAIVDKVALAVDGSGRVVANVPSGAQLVVYGKTATTETTTPLVIALSVAGRSIVTTNAGMISFNFDRLFEAIGPAASGALAVLAQNRVNSGTYAVTMAIGTLRLAHAASTIDPTLALTELQTVALGAGNQSVVGHGFKGSVVVTP